MLSFGESRKVASTLPTSLSSPSLSPSVLWVRALNVVKATECHDRCRGVAERLSKGARRTAQEGA